MIVRKRKEFRAKYSPNRGALDARNQQKATKQGE